MTLSPRDRQQSFFDVSFLAQNLFDGKDPYSLFRREVLPALEAQRAVLGGMYCVANGRPPLDPVLVAGVTLLQFMEKAPDRQAVERVRFLHLGWKHALGLPVDDAGFHPTSLVYFRQRLLEHQQSRVVFDALSAGAGEPRAGPAARQAAAGFDAYSGPGVAHEPPGEDAGDGPAVPGDARTRRAAGGGARGGGQCGSGIWIARFSGTSWAKRPWPRSSSRPGTICRRC